MTDKTMVPEFYKDPATEKMNLEETVKMLRERCLHLEAEKLRIEGEKDSLASEVESLRIQNNLGMIELKSKAREISDCRTTIAVLTEDVQIAKDKLMQRNEGSDEAFKALQDEVEALNGQLFLSNQSNEKLHQEAAVMSRELNLAREAFREATDGMTDVMATKEGIEELVEICASLRQAVTSYTGYTSFGVPDGRLEVAVRLPKTIRLLWSKMDGAWR